MNKTFYDPQRFAAQEKIYALDGKIYVTDSDTFTTASEVLKIKKETTSNAGSSISTAYIMSNTALNSDSGVSNIATNRWLNVSNATDVYVAGIGDIGMSSDTTKAYVRATANKDSITGVYVAGKKVTLQADSDKDTSNGFDGILKTSINGVAVDAELNTDAKILLAGKDNDTVAAPVVFDLTNSTKDTVTLKSGINSNQVWILDGQAGKSDTVVFNDVTYSFSGKTTVTAGDDKGTYLNFQIADDANSEVYVSAFTESQTFSVNSTVFSAENGTLVETISKKDKNLVVKTAASPTAGSLQAAGQDILTLAASDSATVSADGIIAVANLDGGSWSNLGSESVSVGSETWTFSSTSGVVLNGEKGIADSSDAHVASITGLTGNATVKAFDGAGKTFHINNEDLGIVITSSDTTTVNTDTVIFNDTGSAATVTSSGYARVSIANNDGTIAVAAANNKGFVFDELQISDQQRVDISETQVTSATGITAGTTWEVYGKNRDVYLSDTHVTFSSKVDTDSLAGAITANAEGNGVSAISGLTGEVKFNNGTAAIDSINVMGNDWTFANIGNSEVTFGAATTGAATVAAGTDTAESGGFAVTGVEGASVHATTLTGGSASALAGYFNGKLVNIDGDAVNGAIDVELETTGTNAGVKTIGNVDKGASVTVTGDNAFNIAVTKGSTYAYATSATGADDNSTLSVTDKGVLQVKNVAANASVTATGGNAEFTFDDATSTATANTFAINGTVVTINTAEEFALSNVVVTTNDTDTISAISGLTTNSTITTGADKTFKLSFTGVGTDSTLNVNGTELIFTDTALTSTDLNVTVDGSSNKVVFESGAFSGESTIKASAGTYQVGSGAEVTIEESNGGYLYWDGSALKAEDMSVFEANEKRQDGIDSVATAAEAYQSLAGYDALQNISVLPSTLQGSTVAGFAANDSDTSGFAGGSNTSVANGINLYGNTSLSAATSVTLQSNADGGVNITEDIYNGKSEAVKNVVVDFSEGTADSAVVGNGNAAVTANVTVLGADKQSSIIFGDNASGNNVAEAGERGAYIYHSGKGKSTLLGNTGSDTIYTSRDGDYIEGGTGTDYFYDAANYTIQDYDAAEQGDVIRVTKASSISYDNITVDQNTIQVGKGGKITLGSEYDDDSEEATQKRMAILNTGDNASNNVYVAWSSAYGASTVDASSFTSKGALIIANNNEDYDGDDITGSSGADTIYAGVGDTVNAGAGADYIHLENAASDDLGVNVSIAAGKNTVDGWNFGFDNSQGNSQLIGGDKTPNNLKYKWKNNHLTLVDGTASITFADTVASGENYDILYGDTKIRVIESGKNSTVNSSEDFADYYTGVNGKKASLTFGAEVEDAMALNLGDSGQFSMISAINDQRDVASDIYGSEGKDTVQVGGSVDNSASKTVSLGGGNDVIISTGNDTDAAGHTFEFGDGDGRDTIKNFSYLASADDDPYGEAADTLYLDSYVTLSGSAKSIEFATTDEDKVALARSTTDSTVSDDILKLQIGTATATMKVGRYTSGGNSHANNFTYDSRVNLYWGNAEANKDTLTVSTDSNANIWLANDPNKVTYLGFGAINASGSEGINATLVGNANNNTITGAGTGSYSTLWGGTGGSNELNGSSGEDTFLFAGKTSDTVNNFAEDDTIWLFNVGFASGGFVADSTEQSISMKFTDGSTLNLNHSGSDSVKFKTTGVTGAANGTYTYTFSTNSWS